MARLYVYTTLPLLKIVDLVHSRMPGPAPGHESAHKKLNILLDKEPRWLHPSSKEDMDRRITELANSPTRIKSAIYAAHGHSRSMSSASRKSFSPHIPNTETSMRLENLAFPALHRLAVNLTPIQQASGVADRAWTPHDDQSTMSIPSAGFSPSQAEDTADQPLFASFLRQTTRLSSSTNNTTGSFHRVLSGFPETYVQTVKKLVKRFTAPMASQSSLSHYSEGYSTSQTWVDKEDRPPELDGRPFPIPSDFLNIDAYHNNMQCYFTYDGTESHHCSCSVALATCVLPWVTCEGLTSVGQRILTDGPREKDFGHRDSFGNTVLHFLAARGSTCLLERSLESELCKSLMGAKNSAGQTFLHVLNLAILRDPNYVESLLDIVARKGHDIHARDHYGRSFFHLIRTGGHPEVLIRRIASRCNPKFYIARDAFGVTPAPSDSTMALQKLNFTALRSFSSIILPTDPGIAKESKLLESVRVAMQNPHFHDDEGRNGLHCLAMATLSTASIVHKYHLQSLHQDRVSRKRRKPENELDSSSSRLILRLELLTGLLDSGVDPNQHDNNGNTPLMAFVAELPEDDDYKVPPKILQLLLAKGANIHARNRRGETALHVAVRCGQKLAMRTLSERGANVHATDSAGRSLLDVADARMVSCDSDEHTRDYAHYEACRAWLSGKGLALQVPSVMNEWGMGCTAQWA
ncbi:ankyrin repeat protein [Metarhizium rileyi]|uniref:Ankyrin repeat protein n=1 Tax=Metarhizium rileyi (strain RCEF 4871) TaxID=1649241 RepID=A0A167CJN1_METRR|nr:ankyrin repeat protein [Metarhizium rileyi RCEF 4871]